MKFAMCNEFCPGWSVAQVCQLAVQTGYQGIEFAPFTLGATVFDITPAQRREVRQIVTDAGLEVVGLHWLLAKTEGMHIHDPDPAIAARTRAYYAELIRCCAQMGGTRMIHGSPVQRTLLPGEKYDDAFARTAAFFAAAAPVAAAHGVTLCVEPLARNDADFLTTAGEAVRLIEQINHPHVQLILDCKAMTDESASIPELIHRHHAHLAHFHANDDNRSYPGSGTLDFTAALRALRQVDYRQWVSIEVFDFTPPPLEIAQRGLAHLRACLAQA